MESGTKVILNNAPLYVRYGSRAPIGTKTGEFYIWSVTVANDRIRVTNKKENAGKPGQVVGWINTKDIAIVE